MSDKTLWLAFWTIRTRYVNLFLSQSSHLPTRRSDFREITKVPYHVTFDFDLDLDVDLEHTLDACSSGDHRVQLCTFIAN